MSANVMLDTNDIRDICNYLDYVLKVQKKRPDEEWDDTFYNQLRIRQLQYKLKHNKGYIEHERKVRILKANIDAGIDLEKETI
jgi:hypothetical protein